MEGYEARNLPKDFHCPLAIGRVVKYLNDARTEPKKFAQHIQNQLKKFKEDKIISLQGVNVTAIEGKSAYYETIQFLNKQTPLKPLTLNYALSLAADDHCVDMTVNNMFGHKSTDGSGVRERIERRVGETVFAKMGECCDRVKAFHGPDYELATVVRLIIDEGVSSRGHRTLIFTPEFKFVGISGRVGSEYIKITVDFCAIGTGCSKSTPNDNTIGNQLTGKFSRNETQFAEKRGQKFQTAPNEGKQKKVKEVIDASEVLKWLNIARTEPKSIAAILQQKLDNDFIDDKTIDKDGLMISCLQGKSAYREAIKFLKAQQPLVPFELNECLCLAADDHVKDMIKNNIFGHTSSDGSSMTDRIKKRHGKTIYGKIGQCCDRMQDFEGPNFAQLTVLRYILDEGVPSRGHRENIYTPDFKFVGSSLRKDKNGYKGTLDFCSIFLQVKGQESKNKTTQVKKTKNDQIGFGSPPPQKTVKKTVPSSSQISAEDTLNWLNIARTTPKKIAQILQQKMDTEFLNDKTINKDGLHVMCLEGKSAYREAINFLKQQSSLEPLQLNECLSLAADDHVKDMIKSSIFGHTGSDGSSMTDRITRRHGKTIYAKTGQCCDQPKDFEGPDFPQITVLRYILDEGVPSRGHRKIIFTPEFKYVGISMRKDSDGYKGTLDFCSKFLDTASSGKPETAKKSKNQTIHNVKTNAGQFKNQTPKKPPKSRKNFETNQDILLSSNNDDINNFMNKMKQDKNINVRIKNPGFEEDIFDKLKENDDWKTPAKKDKKQVKSVSTSTKTVTSNGIKKTTVTKTTTYTDGTVQTITTTSG